MPSKNVPAELKMDQTQVVRMARLLLSCALDAYLLAHRRAGDGLRRKYAA